MGSRGFAHSDPAGGKEFDQNQMSTARCRVRFSDTRRFGSGFVSGRAQSWHRKHHAIRVERRAGVSGGKLRPDWNGPTLRISTPSYRDPVTFTFTIRRYRAASITRRNIEGLVRRLFKRPASLDGPSYIPTRITSRNNWIPDRAGHLPQTARHGSSTTRGNDLCNSSRTSP